MDSKKEVHETIRPSWNEPPSGDYSVSQIKTGTADDAKDMHRLGKTQEFRRNFRPFCVLGLSSVIMATWVAILGSASFALINSGLAGTIWMYVGMWAFTVPVTLSLAEMASMAPTSEGQYHWTSEFAPEFCQTFLSYIIRQPHFCQILNAPANLEQVGWLSALGWQAAIVVTAYGARNIILKMAHLSYPSYVPTAWQGTLMTMAVVAFSVVLNTVGAKYLPLFETVILFLHIFGFSAVLNTFWVLAPKAPAKEVFTSFSNFGGWSSVGAACIVGQLTATGSLGVSDSPAHLAEEVRNASTTVPRVMIITIILNGILGFVMVVTCCFCITDIVTMIVESTSVSLYVNVFQTATGSTSGTIALVSIITALNICANLSVLAAGSRQICGWLRKITTIGTPIPVNSIIILLTVTIVISLLNVASATAFNSIVGLLCGSGGVSYSISIGCVLWWRLAGKPLPKAPFTLGKWGIPINAVAILFCILTTVIIFFPMLAQTTVEYMNYGVVMFAGAAVISMVYYFVHGR